MASGDKTEPGDPAVEPAANEQPFDKWLRKQLHAMFDEVVNEPLPSDLIRLIDEDADRARHDAAAKPSSAPPSDDT